MTKKKVTAPLTYNPGKGRPKEHLAYLNYQEMQALQRLNGEGPYKGPKGIPSFVLGGATTKGTAANRAMSSASQSSTKKSSGPSSSLNAPSRTAPSSAARQGSSISKGNVGTARQGSPVSKNPFGGGARDSGQAGSRVDAAFKKTAESRSVSSANKTPALKQDRSRTINVGPMGTPVKIGTPSRQERPSIPRATTPMATQGTSFRSPLEARVQNRFTINDAKLRSGALGVEGVKSLAQIAADNARRLNTIKMAQQYSQYRFPPSVAPPAPQGVFGPRVGEGTGYLRTATIPGMITTGMPSELSGMPGPRFNAEKTLRAYEEAKRIANAKPIQDRIPASKFYEDRVPSEPRLSVGRSAVAPTTPPLMAEDGTYKRPGRDPAVERALAEAGFDPSGRRLQDLIDPSIPGRLAAGSTRPRPDPSLLRAYQGGFGPELMGAAGSEIERNLLARDPSRLDAYKGGFGPELMGAAGSELERSLLSDYEKVQSSLGRTRGLEAERILEVENLLSDAGVRKPISGFSARSRGIESLVPEETVPGFGVDVNNIPRVRSVILDSDQAQAGTPKSGYSGYGAFNVPRINYVSPEIRAPQSEKIYTNPIADRVPSVDTSGEPLNPSVIGDINGGSVAYKQTDAIATPPSLSPRQEVPMRFVGDDGKEYFITREQFERLDQEDRNRLAEQYARQDQVAPPKPRLRPTENTAEGVVSPDTPSEDYPEEGSAEDGVQIRDEAADFPKYVDPEIQEKMRRQEKLNKVSVGIIKSRNPVLSVADALKKLFTGETIAGSSAALKRQYMQSSDEQKAELERRYPNLTRFAKDVGLTPQLPMSNYTKWAERSGLLGTPTREGGRSGIADLPDRSSRDEDEGEDSGGSTTPSGQRPDIYYMWDLGVNIPSPGDPNYTQYQTYLAERLAAQQAMGFV